MSGAPPHRDHEEPAVRRNRVGHEVAHQVDTDMTCGLESEGRDAAGKREIVVDGLRYVHNAKGAAGGLGQFGGTEGRIVTADREQRADTEFVQGAETRFEVLL